MVGYNWRFHPELQALRRLVNEPWTAVLDCSTDINRWPGRDYGDPLLECSHEIAVALQWLGPNAELSSGYAYDTQAHVYLRNHAGSECSIHVRWHQLPMRWFSMAPQHAETEWTLRPSPAAVEASYLAELKHFLACVESGYTTDIPFAQGLRVVELCERVKELAS
jgi:predicted dehydrogenase